MATEDVPASAATGGAFTFCTCDADWPMTEAPGSGRMIEPKFQLILVLQGEQHFALDDTAFALTAGAGANRQPVAFLMCLTRDTLLRPLPAPATHIRKLMISAPLSFVDELAIEEGTRSRELTRFLSGHIEHLIWTPDANLIRLAEEIMAPPRAIGMETRRLHQRAKALEVMSLACAALIEHRCPALARSSPVLAAERQCQRARDYIFAHLGDDLTIEAIARASGASVSTLQRNFRDRLGTTVFDFIRTHRLETARQALERTGISIQQAAYIAGYASPSNFTSAFKRHYGVTPKRHRA